MSVSAVIPTVKRPDALRRAVDSVLAQSQPVTEVIISAIDPAGVPPEISSLERVVVLTGAKGASAQRNLAVAHADPAATHLLFIDDDTVLHPDYVRTMVQTMEANDLTAASGQVVVDGVAERREVDPDEIAAALAAAGPVEPGWHPDDHLYGCNMVVRADAARLTPFDEALPMYSWLEDLDFARRLGWSGRLGVVHGAWAAHQGSSSGGRLQHRRLGYSQVANPAHLMRKGSIGPVETLTLVARPLVGNVRRLLGSEERAAGRQRLAGAGLALADLARGRITPGRITSM